MKEQYQYPLDLSWTTEEMIIVTNWYQLVEKAYETRVKAEDCLAAYQAFKKVVPSIGEEKRLGREFEEVSGYSLYRVIQQAKSKQTGEFSMKEKEGLKKCKTRR